MAAGDEDVLRIRVIDQRPDEDLELTLKQTFKKFDLAILQVSFNSSKDLSTTSQLHAHNASSRGAVARRSSP
jgi:hypothetical protein